MEHPRALILAFLLVGFPAVAEDRLYSFYQDATDAYTLSGESCSYQAYSLGTLRTHGTITEVGLPGGGMAVEGTHVVASATASEASAGIFTDCAVTIPRTFRGQNVEHDATPLETIGFDEDSMRVTTAAAAQLP